MKIELFQDLIEIWIYAERYLSAGTRQYSPFASINEMDSRYQPGSKAETFIVPTFWADASADIRPARAGDLPSDHRVHSFYAPVENRFLLPIHPGTLALLPTTVHDHLATLQRGPLLVVSPTASTRTVYVRGTKASEPLPAHFLKLHFPGRISRFKRELPESSVSHQLWVSEQVRMAAIPHLPDLFGGFASLGGERAFGFLVRSAEPQCGLQGPFLTVPGFALYGRDIRAPHDPPLFVQLALLFGEDPVDFVTRRVVAPAVNLWVTTVRKLGIIPELHGQNLLVCIDAERRQSSVCFRDSNLFVDCQSRHILGLGCSDVRIDPDSLIRTANNAQLLSLCYDTFLIHHFLAPLSTTVEQRCGVSHSVLRAVAVNAFEAAVGGTLSMPDHAFTYSTELYEEDEFRLVEDLISQIWR